VKWLTQTLTEQPEFATCVVSKMSDFIFEGRILPLDVRERLRSVFKKDYDLGKLLETLVVLRAFGTAALDSSDATTVGVAGGKE
jgi:hypothetical protein